MNSRDYWKCFPRHAPSRRLLITIVCFCIMWGVVVSESFGQINIATLTESDMQAVKFSSVAATDSNTNVFFTSGSNTLANGVYNLVGNSSNSTFSILASNSIASTSGSGTEAGVVFRVRLGAYDLSSISTNLAVIVGVGPEASPAKAGFGLMAVVSSSGTSGAVYIMDAASNSQADKGSELISQLGKNTSADPLLLVKSVDPSTNTEFLSYSSTTGVFNGASGDTADAWLTFAVPYSSVNVATTAASRTISNVVVPFDSSSGKWNVSVGVFSNVTIPTLASGTAVTGTTQDFTSKSADSKSAGSSLLFSDAIYLTGSTTAVPEASTWFITSGILAPALGVFLLRKRRKTPADL